jgi:hypothetical protein
MAAETLTTTCSFCGNEFDERDVVDAQQENVCICLKCAELAVTILTTVKEMRDKE